MRALEAAVVVSSRRRSHLRYGLSRWVLPHLGTEPLAVKNLSQKAWPKVAALSAGHDYADGLDSVQLGHDERDRADDILLKQAAVARPVVLRGLCDADSWTFDRVKQLVGNREVDVRVGDYVTAPGDPDTVRMSVAAFVDYLEGRAPFPSPERLVDGLGPYIGNNAGLTELGREVPTTALATDHFGVHFWIGGDRAGTPLHCHQNADVVLVQLIGRRRVALIPPHQAPLVGCVPMNINICTAGFDPFSPDRDEFPGTDQITVLHCDVGPGDALLIPGFWFHAVQLDAPSLSGTVSSRDSMPASIGGGPRQPWRTDTFSPGW